jgi:hypothetical protein
MQNDHETSQIRAHAQKLLRGGTIGSDLVVASGRIETPIAVQSPSGRLHSWFVPVTVGDKLTGFFQFRADGTFMRFSSFQRRASDLAGCPATADWLDPNRIQARAEVQCQPDETSGKPFLTYDRTPDRLVWAVPLTNARGEVRLVYVAGETVYVPPPEDTYG